MNLKCCMLKSAVVLLYAMTAVSFATASDKGRTTFPLNGTWEIEESVGATEIPTAFTHKVVVPGLVNLSQPAFPQVDWFASREYMQRWQNKGYRYPFNGPEILAKDAPLPAIGIPVQKRNYFWYQTSFKPPQKRAVALLRIGKAQFGTQVWLNGKDVGKHLGCWTSRTYNLTDAIHWSGENQLLVRIGAHPAVLPENIPGAGMYSSKHKWTPGIYDDVSLMFCDNPVIESIQVAPRIDTAEVVVQTKVKNYGQAKSFELGHTIRTFKDGFEAAALKPQSEQIGAGEEKTFTQTLKLPDAHLWSPEDPFLYVVESQTGGDSVRTRFGMREYVFDNKKGVGYLNGKPYYLRGGNIELHLHFEDPLCGATPWDRAWVKKLIVDIPKKLNWNAFRFSMSPVPDFWLEMADEAGLLIQYEPPVWAIGGVDTKKIWSVHPQWDPNEFIKEYANWMSDNWNHPCIFMWDSNNESRWPELVKIVNAVRPLDLSKRAWDNSWSPPASPNDPVEEHPYAHCSIKDWRAFNTFDGRKRLPGNRCRIINEYAWLWLYPDNEPIDIAGDIYRGIPAAERQEYRYYLTAAMTEMWRAQRCAVAVLDYQYCGSYLPRKQGPCHFGDFADVAELRLYPEFEKYMAEAFKPLGVYLAFWGDGEPGKAANKDSWFPIRGGTDHAFTVMMVNDDQEPATGKLEISVETLSGQRLAAAEKPFRVEGAGKNAYELTLPIPNDNGKYLLKSVAYPDGSRHPSPTVSLRKVVVEAVTTPAMPAKPQDTTAPNPNVQNLLGGGTQ